MESMYEQSRRRKLLRVEEYDLTNTVKRLRADLMVSTGLLSAVASFSFIKWLLLRRHYRHDPRPLATIDPISGALMVALSGRVMMVGASLGLVRLQRLEVRHKATQG